MEKVREVGINNKNIQDIIEKEIATTNNNSEAEDIKVEVRKFLSKLRQKYDKHSRNFQRLAEKEAGWLEGVLFEAKDEDMDNVINLGAGMGVAGPGRPVKQWGDASDRTKKRKIQLLKENNNTEALASAAVSRSKDSPGQKDLGTVLKETMKNPVKVRNSIDAMDKTPVMMSPEDALALKIQCDLSDSQYQLLRNASLKQNADIFPTLHNILDVKANCYPEHIEITETSAKCSLQSMLDHTLSRIVKQDEDMMNEVGSGSTGTLYLKAGMDGASSQSIYNQRFEETDLEVGKLNEESLFQTAVVPLKLVLNEKTVWVNSKPNSSHFCRPLHLQYKKETVEVTKAEEDRINEEARNLESFQLDMMVNGEEWSAMVKYNIDMTMLDGKAVNALTDNKSSQSCNVCGSRPSEMNNLKVIREQPVSERTLKLGLSSLHCWMRCFEYILHLGYKLENQTFQAKSQVEKDSVARRKTEIKKRFREELSLVVDTPKQGFGNTNTGNTARRAFEESAIFADITGVDEGLISRIRNILKAVCSGYELDINKFRAYCLETSEMVVRYTMPPTLHKLLEHGFQVAEVLDLPIGMYSEEAQEAQNKEIRNARLSHTCKVSRKNAMKNQFQYLLIRSDPVISSTAFKKSKSFAGQPLDAEVLNLLM